MASSKSRRNPGNRDQAVIQQNGAQETGAQETVAQESGTYRPMGKKPPRPSQCRNFAREAVAESLPTIVETFVDEAKKGSVPHFNHLAKFSGFDLRPIPAPAKRRGKSLIQKLIDNMTEHEAKMIAARDARLAGERESGQ